MTHLISPNPVQRMFASLCHKTPNQISDQHYISRGLSDKGLFRTVDLTETESLVYHHQSCYLMV